MERLELPYCYAAPRGIGEIMEEFEYMTPEESEAFLNAILTNEDEWEWEGLDESEQRSEETTE
jgi:hypothetical protein